MAASGYYECHITMQETDLVGRGYIKFATESAGWKFSAIDGDPDLGDGVKCYATRHYNLRKPVEEVTNDLEALADYFCRAGIKVLRRKIEQVIYDKREKV